MAGARESVESVDAPESVVVAGAGFAVSADTVAFAATVVLLEDVGTVTETVAEPESVVVV